MTNDIHIRDVDPAALAKIEQICNEKGISRNQFLKSYIENLAVLGELKEYENRYAGLVKSVAFTMNNVTTSLLQVEERLKNLEDKINAETEKTHSTVSRS